MNILQIESGLFPDEETLRGAVKKLDEGDYILSYVDIRILSRKDDSAWDKVVEKIMLAKMVITI
jgi:hypothetical protein|tara:strand:+ start:129 stop:320 length:192 start_codon:yes stop_codon:yes gene_type:complete